MIKNINLWMQNLVVIVILATIFEMILPNGNNKKYIKTIIGIIILFNIVSPLTNKILENGFNTNINNYFSTNSYENINSDILKNNNSNIESIYSENLKNDIKVKLKQKGFYVKNLELKIKVNEENTNAEITKINLEIYRDNIEKDYTDESNSININNIKNIEIIKKTDKEKDEKNEQNNENDKNIITRQEEREIRNFLIDIYGIDSKNINIESYGKGE